MSGRVLRVRSLARRSVPSARKLPAGFLENVVYAVLGATGHIGKQIIAELSETNEQVVAITRDEGKAAQITTDNVKGVAVDVPDTAALRAVLARANRAFLLNPPAPPTSDTNREELRTARSISAALIGSGLEKVVVASTYGAQPGDDIGDLSVLFEFERSVEAAAVPCAINRGAYYFTNLDPMVEPAQRGLLSTPFPDDLVMPMVSPVDLGKAAVDRLIGPVDDVGIRYVEGPSRYTMANVANVMSRLLGHPVELERIPRDGIERSFIDFGFSPLAASAYARMTEATIDNPELPGDFIRGNMTLEQYLELAM